MINKSVIPLIIMFMKFCQIAKLAGHLKTFSDTSKFKRSCLNGKEEKETSNSEN
jgi:hypothetical protein